MIKNLSDNLNILMAKARINSSDLAKHTGIPATTIKRIRTHEQSNPTISTLLPIAKYFSISVGELLGYDPTVSEMKLNISKGINTIPILSWHECMHFDTLDYAILPKKIFTEKQVTEKAYSLIVEDRDINFFPANSILIVEPTLNPVSGDYVIVTKLQQGIASIKKLIEETNQKYLKSLVDGLGITLLTPGYKILGVIVQCRMELKTR